MTTIGTFHDTPCNNFKKEVKICTQKNRQLCAKAYRFGRLETGVNLLPHHTNPSQMTTAGKLGLEPDLDDIQSNGNPYHSGTKAENIGVVVLPAHSGGEGFMAKCCPNVTVSVGGYRHPDTCPADKDTMRTAPILDCRTDLVGKIRIIDRFLGITS